MRLTGFEGACASLVLSDGYVSCEHREWFPGRLPGEAGHHGPQCSQIARFVLLWRGRLSGAELPPGQTNLSKALCSHHGLDQVARSCAKRKER